jgi:hypothetical protein
MTFASRSEKKCQNETVPLRSLGAVSLKLPPPEPPEQPERASAAAAVIAAAAMR